MRRSESDCSFESRNFAHGEKLCISDKCVVCSNGEWKDKTDLFVL